MGKALLIYANDYNDAFPPNLSELIEKAAIDSKMLECPLKPKDFQGPGYIYISGQNVSMHPENILVYENPGFCRDAVNVLYMDSHVAWTKKEQFLRELEATYKRLGRKMPEVKKLDISYNQIAEFPAIISLLPNLIIKCTFLKFI